MTVKVMWFMLGESCNDCVHFIRYPKGEVTCLMRQEFCMIKGKRTYPINCEYYETGVSIGEDCLWVMKC